jgi:hypothetical protein
MDHFTSPFFWAVQLPLSVIPIVIAEKRKCKNLPWIYFLAFFLSWTVLGGIAAIVWALCGEPRLQTDSNAGQK